MFKREKRKLDLGPDGLGAMVGWSVHSRLSDIGEELLLNGFRFRIGKWRGIKHALSVTAWGHGLSGDVAAMCPAYFTMKIGNVYIDHLPGRRAGAAMTLRLMSCIHYHAREQERLANENRELRAKLDTVPSDYFEAGSSTKH